MNNSKLLKTGAKVRYVWTEGAFKDGEYAVDLLEGGQLRWEGLAGAEKGDSATEKSYAATDIVDGVVMLSWLEGIGYTVTLMINTHTQEVIGVASNNEEHYPLKGKLLSLAN